jgi:hypothetical protein
MVVAVPVALLVERHQEQVGSFQLFQHLLAIAATGKPIAQRAAELLEHRGLQQEASHIAGLLLEHLLGQVVKDVAVAAREPLNEPRRIGGPSQG